MCSNLWKKFCSLFKCVRKTSKSEKGLRNKEGGESFPREENIMVQVGKPSIEKIPAPHILQEGRDSYHEKSRCQKTRDSTFRYVIRRINSDPGSLSMKSRKRNQIPRYFIEGIVIEDKFLSRCFRNRLNWVNFDETPKITPAPVIPRIPPPPAYKRRGNRGTLDKLSTGRIGEKKDIEPKKSSVDSSPTKDASKVAQVTSQTAKSNGIEVISANVSGENYEEKRDLANGKKSVDAELELRPEESVSRINTVETVINQDGNVTEHSTLNSILEDQNTKEIVAGQVTERTLNPGISAEETSPETQTSHISGFTDTELLCGNACEGVNFFKDIGERTEGAGPSFWRNVAAEECEIVKDSAREFFLQDSNAEHSTSVFREELEGLDVIENFVHDLVDTVTTEITQDRKDSKWNSISENINTKEIVSGHVTERTLNPGISAAEISPKTQRSNVSGFTDTDTLCGNACEGVNFLKDNGKRTESGPTVRRNLAAEEFVFTEDSAREPTMEDSNSKDTGNVLGEDPKELNAIENLVYDLVDSVVNATDSSVK